MNEEQLRNQINDIIEGEIQLGINEFLEEKQRKESDQGMGFVTSEEAKKLKVKVSKSEIEKIIKQYKKINKKEVWRLLGLFPEDVLIESKRKSIGNWSGTSWRHFLQISY